MEKGNDLVFRVIAGPRAGENLTVAAGETATVGRGPSSTFTFDDRRLSREHCRFEEAAGGWRLHDLESSNGTFVNSERAVKRLLLRGDLVQAGSVVLEVVAGAPHPRGSVEEGAGEPERPRAAARAAASRGASRGASRAPARVPALPLAALALASLAAATAAFFLLRPLLDEAGDDPLPGAGTTVAGRATGAVSPARAPSPAAPAAAAPPALVWDDLAPLIERGDFRAALGRIADAESRAGADLKALRRRTLAAAAAYLARVEREAESLGRESALTSARLEAAAARLEEAMANAPPELDGKLLDAHARLVALGDGLRAEEARSARAAREAASAPPPPGAAGAGGAGGPGGARKEAGAPEVLARDERVRALSAELTRLEAAARLPAAPFEALAARIGDLAREWRREESYARRRDGLLLLFVRARTEGWRRGKLPAITRAVETSLEGGRLRLRWDFTSDLQLEDFQPLGKEGAGARARRGDHLVVAGECRLLDGDPFQGSLSVRAGVAAGGYDRRAPNIPLAFFTALEDRLAPQGGEPPSLFQRLQEGSGGAPPRDYVVLALGYHAVVAEYGGMPITEVEVAGTSARVPLPAHLVLAGARRRPLHRDARECVWAKRMESELSGDLVIEGSVDGGEVRWSLEGKALLGSRALRFPQLETPAEREGSLTLLTRAGSVEYSFLEVDGKVNERWIGERLGRLAAARFAELESAP